MARASFKSLGDNECALTTDRDEWDGGGRETTTFWAPPGGGYVRDTTSQPGTLGRQVCDGLQGSGDCLSWSPRMGALVGLIRREYRVSRREDAREKAECRGW